ncbi:MAG: purine-nucleoside phosphorylase [Chitinophagaceae bacterium]
MTITPALVTETAEFLKKAGFDKPIAGIIMGTGLAAMVDKIENSIIIPFSTIPNFSEATVEFHKGNLIFGSIGTTKVIAMQGRLHYYEGYSMQQITFPVRVMKELGIQHLFLSNAAGGMNPDYKKGDLVMIEDHINLLPDNPLRGLSDPALGQRFVDMSQPYDVELMELISTHASQKNIIIKKGTYVSVMGPTLETKAEYRWLRSTGADMVGMSTVPEVIVANQVRIKCAAISVITDECDPDKLKPVNIPEIIEIAGKADIVLSDLLEALIKELE